MNWSSNEFIWLDWVVLVVGLLGVVAAVWLCHLERQESPAGRRLF